MLCPCYRCYVYIVDVEKEGQSQCCVHVIDVMSVL